MNLAADRTDDHLHDGMGFLTQHVALTNEFERALQAVDGAASVPYWDYTFVSRAPPKPLPTLEKAHS